jgi:hypothetical protein
VTRERQWLSSFDYNMLGFGITARGLQQDYTRERIKEYFVTHPGASSKDASYDLGLSSSTISHYRSSIRKEWMKHA